MTGGDKTTGKGNGMNWNDRAKAVFAQGCNTYSKRADQYIEGVYPTHYEDFHGVDFVGGLGSNLIGWENNFSLPSQKEVILGERIKELFPCIDKMKIVKTGSAACSAAVRIARAYTGKSEVVGCGYHGAGNTFISAEDPGKGTVFEFYKKVGSLTEIIFALKHGFTYDEGAAICTPGAVIIEPVQLDMNVKSELQEIRSLCTMLGVVLIFDEVITGFRVPKYSISNYFGIQPDLICLGKALGNGYPIAMVGGRDDIMETPGYFISNTHNGELSAIEASLKTLDYLTEEKLQQLWELGGWFQKEFNAINPKIQIKGYPTRGELQGEETFKAIFMQEMLKAGFLFGRAWFLNFAHKQEILSDVIRFATDVCSEIENETVRLEGLMPRPLFRRN